MPGPLRHLAAIRTRLLSSPELVALVGQRVYLGHIFDVTEATFPCVTLRQARGSLARWAPRTINPCNIVIDCFSKKDVAEPSTLDELVEALLHMQKTSTSTNEACFHEIVKMDWNTAFYDQDTGAWRQSSMYLVRASIE